MKKHLGAISSLAINPADGLLYSASVDATVKVWCISKLKCIETIRAHTEPINAIVVGEDGVFYTASDDATVKVWRRQSYGCGGDRSHSLALTLPTDSSPVKALALTADGMVLYGGCTDGYLHCWLKGWLSGHMHYGGPLQGHRHAVLCLACTSNYVASGSADSTCRVWVRDGEGLHTCLAVLEGHMGPVRCVAAFAAGGQDGCMVCTASLDGTLKVWRITSSGSVSQGPTQGGLPTFQF